MQQRTQTPMALVFLLVLMILVLGGCSNKAGREGKVQVVLSERLQAKGVVLEDWRYTPSEKSFGVKLKSTKTLDRNVYLIISGPGIGQLKSPMPAGNWINNGEWIDFGGSPIQGYPFASFPESGTITIDAR